MKEAARALNDANVALYAVDARGLVFGTRGAWGLTIPGLDTMNNLAGLTGGKAFYVDNALDSLIEESVEDSELIGAARASIPRRNRRTETGTS